LKRFFLPSLATGATDAVAAGEPLPLSTMPLAHWTLSPQLLALHSSQNTAALVCSVSLPFEILCCINKSLFDDSNLYYAAMP